MKRLIIPFIDTSEDSLRDCFARSLATLEQQMIACNPWPKYRHAVDAGFVVGHNGDTIGIKYTVEEDQVKASADFNEEMHKDSCVELFIAFEDNHYYNLEFNCLGYCKIGYGKERSSRKTLPLPLVESISSYARIDSALYEGRKRFRWELALLIPITVFCYTSLDSLRGREARANFYKCGDSLYTPHFLAWNHIELPEPDFHAPDFFGRLHFS